MVLLTQRCRAHRPNGCRVRCGCPDLSQPEITSLRDRLGGRPSPRNSPATGGPRSLVICTTSRGSRNAHSTTGGGSARPPGPGRSVTYGSRLAAGSYTHRPCRLCTTARGTVTSPSKISSTASRPSARRRSTTRSACSTAWATATLLSRSRTAPQPRDAGDPCRRRRRAQREQKRPRMYPEVRSYGVGRFPRFGR